MPARSQANPKGFQPLLPNSFFKCSATDKSYTLSHTYSFKFAVKRAKKKKKRKNENTQPCFATPQKIPLKDISESTSTKPCLIKSGLRVCFKKKTSTQIFNSSACNHSPNLSASARNTTYNRLPEEYCQIYVEPTNKHLANVHLTSQKGLLIYSAKECGMCGSANRSN